MAKKRKTETQANTFDDGMVLDVSDIDNTLTDRAKRFVFWFTYPGTDCFQHKTRAAIRAGYAKKNAVTSGYKLCQNPKVKAEIERLSKTYVSEQVDTLFNRYVESLEQRAFYDVADFYEGEQLKSLSEIEGRKRIALDGIDYKGNKGDRKVYMFGDRKTALKEIRELHKEAHPAGIGDAFDIEETKEIIMERVTLRQQYRKTNAAEFAEIEQDIVERPINPDIEIAEEL